MNLDGLFPDPPGPTRIAFQALSVEARNAFKQEILPQLVNLGSAALVDAIGEVTTAVGEAARSKDTLYTRLVRHKAIDQADDSFFADVLVVLSQWVKEQSQDDPKAAPAEPFAQPVMQPQVDSVQALREDIVDQLGPAQNLTPWDLAHSLQTVFQQHGIRQASATVRSRNLVSVGFGTYGIEDLELEHHPGRGWFTAVGFGPKTAAREIMVRVAKAG